MSRVSGGKLFALILFTIFTLIVGSEREILWVSAQANDSLGAEFVIVYTDNLEDGTGADLLIASAVDATGLVEIPGLGFSQPFNVTANSSARVDLPLGAEVQGSEVIANLGIRVTADQEIALYLLNPGEPVTSNDAYLALPVDVLGSEYIVMSWPDTLFGAGLPGVGPAEIAIVAPADGTDVTIIPSVDIGLHPAGIPYTITLDALQTYTLQTNSVGGDLTGTVIQATQPVAVFAGNRCVSLPDAGCGFCDHLVEQLPPSSTWGQEFNVFPLAQQQGDNFLRVVASQNGTNVLVDGVTVTNLNQGQVQEIALTSPVIISTSAPALVAQFAKGQNCSSVSSDPFMILVAANTQFLFAYDFVVPSGYPANFANVIIPTSALGTLTLDGAPVDSALFSPIGAGSYSGATLPLTVGAHHLSSSDPFGAYIYGFGPVVSYGYPAGLALGPVTAPPSTLTPTPTATKTPAATKTPKPPDTPEPTRSSPTQPHFSPTPSLLPSPTLAAIAAVTPTSALPVAFLPETGYSLPINRPAWLWSSIFALAMSIGWRISRYLNRRGSSQLSASDKCPKLLSDICRKK
ncbi:MAG: IgGFc-binding protein [Anaerolineales bacterium]|nr:IgGFc-binding protein [Anaerolineales bacterium]